MVRLEGEWPYGITCSKTPKVAVIITKSEVEKGGLENERGR
jgi:hypothetical protein